MSTDSSRRLNRQLDVVQTEEFEKWLQSTGSYGEDEEIGVGDWREGVKEEGDVVLAIPEKSNKALSSERSSSTFKGSLTSGDNNVKELEYRGIQNGSSELLLAVGRPKLLKHAESRSPWKYSAASEMEERRWILADLDHNIGMEVKRYNSRIHNVNKRWDKSTKKQQFLSQTLNKMDLLLTDCKAKRESRIQMLNEELSQKDSYLSQIKEDENLLKTLSNLLRKIERRVENHRMFENILRDVKNQSQGRFRTVREVMNRAISLENTRQRIVDWELENQKDIRGAIQELARFTERSRRNNVRDSELLKAARAKADETSHQLSTAEEKAEVTKMHAQRRKLVHGQLQLCVNNLHIELSRQLRLKPKYFDSQPYDQIKSIAILLGQLGKLKQDINVNAVTASNAVAIEVDTQALDKLRLKYKLNY